MIKITAGEGEFLTREDLWSRGIHEVFEQLAGDHAGCGLVAVGPARERGLAASVVATPDGMVRTEALGGLGAVMGRKGVKALVIDDADGPGATVAEPARFWAVANSLTEGIATHPLTGGFRAPGTAVLVGLINERGGLPTRNYSSSLFERAERLSGEAVAGLLAKRPGAATAHRCMAGCIVHCSQGYTDAQGQLITSGLEYETRGLVGSNCAIDAPDAIAGIDRACDDLGLDTMEVGAALAVAMQADRLPWGEGAGALAVVESIRAGDPLGLLAASGCVAVGRELAVQRVPGVKGQSLAAYDPRILKGTGVTYATSPMGADHTAGNALPHPGYDPSNHQGQAKVSGFLQGWMAVVDTLGLCLFASVPVMESPDLQEQLAAAVRAKLGRDLPEGDLIAMGTAVWRTEREFNRRAGFTPSDDRLPAFFAEEVLTPTGNRWDVPEADLDRVFG